MSKKVIARVDKPKAVERGSWERWIRSWSWRVSFMLLLASLYRYLDRNAHRWYVFDPESLHELAQSAVVAHGNDTSAMISFIVSNLTATYPQDEPEHKVISLNLQQDEWVFNNAGGAMGAMYIIHASVTEYLIIFGTPLGTEGHTGLHTADDYFNILHGEQWAFSPGALEKEVYGPGSVHHLPRGTAKQYKMHTGCFALEYARGLIPPMLPFGLADVVSSTLDFPTFYHTARITGREMFKNLLIGKI